MKRRSALTGLAGLLVATPLVRLGATAPPPPKSAWRSLFDGRSSKGWTVWQEGSGLRDAHRAVTIHHGMLHFLGPDFDGPDKASFGHLATTTEFADYHLRLEFRWGERRFAPRDLQRRNSGILYHMSPDLDRLFPDCVEYQVQEGDVGAAVMVNTRVLQGPLLGGTPLWPNYFPGLPTDYQKQIVAGGIARQWHPHSGPYERLGDWNTLDLYAFGDQAAHLVNGRIFNTLFKLIDRNGAAPNQRPDRARVRGSRGIFPQRRHPRFVGERNFPNQGWQMKHGCSSPAGAAGPWVGPVARAGGRRHQGEAKC